MGGLLGTTLVQGLSAADAEARLREEGFNELPRTDHRTVLRIALDVLREPMLALLLVAGLIYLLLGDVHEALLLLAFALFSILITIFQETRTERVLESLRDLTSPRALVIRDGVRTRIPGREVVRGDVVILNEGDRVPADGIIRREQDLLADESLLTGESVPVRKSARRGDDGERSKPGGDDTPFVYSGSLIVRGSALVELVATGLRSEIGKIGRSLSELERESPRLRAQTERLVMVFAWVGAAYIAAATVAAPILGKLSDLYGRRFMFELTMGLFAVGSLLCALAQSMGQLIAFRAVQGFGGGAVQALAFAMLGDILPPRERGRYIGYFTIAFAGSALLGPLIGGFVVEHWTWPWIFWIQVPPCLLAIVLCHRALRDIPFPRRSARIDLTGAVLLAATLCCLVIGLENGKDGWTKAPALGFLGASVVLVALFIWRERLAPEPMLPLRLFRNRVVVSSTIMGMCAGSVSFGAMQFAPLFFQDVKFVRPVRSGLWMLPMIVGVTLGTLAVGRLVARSGRYKRYPIVGMAIASCGLALLSTIDRDTAYLAMIVPMFVIGYGTASVYTTTSIATQNSVEFRDLGVATATVMFFRSLGGSLGLALDGTVLNSTVRAELTSRLQLGTGEAISLIRAPAEIRALPDAARQAVTGAISVGVGRVFLIASVVVAIGFVWALRMPELPLRDKAGLADVLEGG